MATLPVLYSFRRCPYAMRARMALAGSNTPVELREVVLRSKPEEMLAASPKATVPVLVLENGRVLEESLDIALWALEQRDPEHWLPDDKGARAGVMALIERFDGPFKNHLDHYKYATRHVPVGEDWKAYAARHRTSAMEYIGELEDRLADGPFLFGASQTLADNAIAPFIRQFANTDAICFAQQPCPNVQRWLESFITSDLFTGVMQKYPQWESGSEGVPFGG